MAIDIEREEAFIDEMNKPLNGVDRLRMWHTDPDTFDPIDLDDAEEILSVIDDGTDKANAWDAATSIPPKTQQELEELRAEKASLQKVAEAASDFLLGHQDEEFAGHCGGVGNLAVRLNLFLEKYQEDHCGEDCRNSPV